MHMSCLEYLCWLYQSLGNTDKAMDMAKKMIAIKPDLFNGYGNVGAVYFQQKNYPEAKKWFMQALAKNNSPTTWVPQLQGYALMATRRAKEGIELFETNIAHEETPYWMKAKYHLWLGKGLVNFSTNWEGCR